MVSRMEKKQLLLLLCIGFLINCGYSKMNNYLTGGEEDGFQLQRRSLKTIQLEEGDVVDCIPINKQPALDHPLLKNHKIQMRPSSFPNGMDGVFHDNDKPHSSLRRRGKEVCPTGTVPIHRTKSLKNDGFVTNKVNTNQSDYKFPGKHVAFLKTKNSFYPIYKGVYGASTIYNLTVQPDGVSFSAVMVQNGPIDRLNVLAAGWMVSPAINGDSLPRLSIYWTVDGHKTGCFNLACGGFVQVNPEVGIKYPFKQPVSVIGEPPKSMRFTIYQDRSTGNWWLTGSSDEVIVGYWPRELLSGLKDGANGVAWGGFAIPGKSGKSPPMGSGRKPDNINHDAAYFRQLHYINRRFYNEVPSTTNIVQFYDQSGCYGLVNKPNLSDPFMGFSFEYGGPGGICGN